jgi:type IV secretion system protein VirD4
MQLPDTDEIVLVAGYPPIRAKRARCFDDGRLKRRIMAAPTPREAGRAGSTPDDWSNLPAVAPPSVAVMTGAGQQAGDGGLRWEAEVDPPDLVTAESTLAPDLTAPTVGPEVKDEGDEVSALQARFRQVARQAALDPDDGLGL